MAFRGLPTERERWSWFCERHRALVDKLESMAIAFSSPHRFEELLESGVTQSKDASAELSSLSAEEWEVFEAFVERFRNDWQTYFVPTLYPAYFRAAERRGQADH